MQFNFQFPQSYREYLEWMGKDTHGIFRGSNWFIHDIQENKQILREILDDIECQYKLEPSHVVFFTHQGYMAAWFDASENATDPTCWFVNDGMTVPKENGSFSTALLNDLKGLAQCLTSKPNN